MRRREFVATGCCSLLAISAGCLVGNESEPVAEITSIEVRNDRHEESHEFVVRIEDEEDTLTEETYHLEPSDPEKSGVVIEEPVDPGTYTVSVETEEHSAAVDTQDIISDDQTCVRLKFYLSAEALHSEYQLFDRCE